MGAAIVLSMALLFIAFIVFLTRGGTDDTTDQIVDASLEHMLADNLEYELSLNDYGAQEGNDGRNV